MDKAKITKRYEADILAVKRMMINSSFSFLFKAETEHRGHDITESIVWDCETQSFSRVYETIHGTHRYPISLIDDLRPQIINQLIFWIWDEGAVIALRTNIMIVYKGRRWSIQQDTTTLRELYDVVLSIKEINRAERERLNNNE